MAAANLVPVTIGGNDYSDDQTIASGAFHTVIPLFQGGAGKVIVEVKNSDDSYQIVATLRSNPRSPKEWQLRGPLEYRVGVRNAGADLDTGA